MSHSKIADHHNKYNDENVRNLVRILKRDSETQSEGMLLENVATCLLTVGSPETFHLRNTQYMESMITEKAVKIRSICIKNKN